MRGCLVDSTPVDVSLELPAAESACTRLIEQDLQADPVLAAELHRTVVAGLAGLAGHVAVAVEDNRLAAEVGIDLEVVGLGVVDPID